MTYWVQTDFGCLEIPADVPFLRGKTADRYADAVIHRSAGAWERGDDFVPLTWAEFQVMPDPVPTQSPYRIVSEI